MPDAPKKIVLAYSGGLDTSVILPWLKNRYPGVQCVAFACELGQGSELDGVEKKARESGADDVIVADLRREFAEDYCFPMLRAHATYERDYLLGTSIARPLIAKAQVEAARQVGADAVAHGATGKGNDQVRFELTYMALAPDLQIIAPWKMPDFELRDREAAIDYAKEHGVPVVQSREKIYSQDRNLWHISHEGAEIEDPAAEPKWERCLTMTRPISEAPDTPQHVRIGFDQGNPVSVDGEALPGHDLIAKLNDLAGTHGVGVKLLVENRLVGMKSRGVYETPGGTALYRAHNALEQLVLERDLFHAKEKLALDYARVVYNGQWFHPLREAMQAFVDKSNERCTGDVTLSFYKGTCDAIAVESPHSLYDPDLASFSMDGYDVTAARGFIDCFGLPMKVAGIRDRRER
ncbi:MAG: argininosuccinate synthase [Planctomycetota bacterium]